jgi:hypothetical protein
LQALAALAVLLVFVLMAAALVSSLMEERRD